MTTTGTTDASSQAWGRLIREPFGAFSVFRAAADFPAEWHNAHSNVRPGDVCTARSTQTSDNDPPRLPQGGHGGRRRRQ